METKLLKKSVSLLLVFAMLASMLAVVSADGGEGTKILDSNNADLSKNISIATWYEESAGEGYSVENGVYTSPRSGMLQLKSTFYPGGVYTVSFKFKSNETESGKDAYPRMDALSEFPANGKTVKGEINWSDIETFRGECTANPPTKSVRDWNEFSYTFTYNGEEKMEVQFGLLTHWQADSTRSWKHSYKDIVITESGNPDKSEPAPDGDTISKTRTISSPSLKGAADDKDKKTVTSADGNFKVYGTKDYVFDSENGWYQWTQITSGNTARMLVDWSNIKLGAGRKVNFKFRYENAGEAGTAGTLGVQLNNNYTYTYATNTHRWIGSFISTKKGEYARWGAWCDLGNGFRAAGKTDIETGDIDIIEFADKVTTEGDKTVYSDIHTDVYRMSQTFENVINSAYSDKVKARFYGIDMTETTPAYKIYAVQNEGKGSVKLSTKSLNFPKDDIADKEIGGSYEYVEHNMTANFAIAAPEGMVIESVVLKNKDKTEKNFTDDVFGKNSAKLEVTLVSQPATLDVKYAKNNMPVVKNVKVTGEKRVGKTMTVSYDYSCEWDLADKSTVRWEVLDGDDWKAIEGAAEKTYVIGEAYDRRTLRAVVTPKNDEKTGAEIASKAFYVGEGGGLQLHVAANGSDETGDGSESKPFATIFKARDVVRSYPALPEGGVEVLIHSGFYSMDKTFELTAEDSGAEDRPVIYRAYGDGEVVFSGSKKLDSSKIQKVTDEALLGRLIETYAKDNLYSLKLDDGITVKDLEGWGWQGPQEGSGKANNANEKFYMNGSALSLARWPNADWSSQENVYTKISIPADVDNTKYNKGNWTLIDLHYQDDENRSLNWQFKKGDMLVGGAFATLWAKQDILVGEFDAKNKRFKTDKDYSAFNPTVSGVEHGSCGIYFSNLFEEIDQPGEMYLDRDTMTLYFMPIGSVEDADMQMSSLRSNLLKFTGAENITFSGVKFENTIATAVSIDKNSSGITFENAVIKGVNYNGLEINGYNHTVRNCDIYDIGGKAIVLDGGDRATLKSSGTVITNNKIHNFNIDSPSQLVGLQIGGCGHVVSHNEIFDSVNGAIRANAVNNLVIEYNEFYNLHKVNSDAGAIYFGANMSDMGNEIRYNYFHNIGGIANGYGIQAIFLDDGETGPAIYGNIIYDSGRSGADPSFPFKTHGGQFITLTNNIIIGKNTNSATCFQKWSPSTWVKRTMYLYDYQWGNGFESGGKDLFFSEKWKEAYKGTQWEKIFDIINEKNYTDLKAKYNSGMSDADFTKYINENVVSDTVHTNKMDSNVFIDFKQTQLYTWGAGWDWAEDVNSKLWKNADDAKGFFKNYGTDFTFTDEGKAELSKTIPAAELAKMDVNKMGIDSKTFNGSKPTVENAVVAGGRTAGDTVCAKYDFKDADGDNEGLSNVYWYIGYTPNGTFTRINGGYGKFLELTESMKGRYVRYEVVPYDTTSAYGIAYASEPLFVTQDIASSEARIEEIEAIVAGATIGTEAGNYSQSSVDTLNAAIAAAKKAISEAKNIDAVNEAMRTLERAVTKFESSKIKEKPSVDEGDDSSSGGSFGGGGSSSGGGGGGGSSSGSGTHATYNGSGNSDNFYSSETTNPSVSTPFADMVNHWAAADVTAMNKAGIVSGVSETSFEPDRNITRAEFAAIIARALGLKDAAAEYDDVDSKDWFAGYVGACSDAGIISGYDGMFRPNDNITRQEMAVVIVNAYSYLEKEGKSGGIDSFTDKAEIADWAKSAVDTASSVGLISGMGDGTFAPHSNATRAQAASIVKRLLDK